MSKEIIGNFNVTLYWEETHNDNAYNLYAGQLYLGTVFFLDEHWCYYIEYYIKGVANRDKFNSADEAKAAMLAKILSLFEIGNHE